jgi:hypothetical protein
MKTETITAEIVTDSPTTLASASEISAINSFHRAATTKADEARTKAQEAAHYALLCGLRLETLKQACPHGEWGQLFAKKGKNLTSNSAQIRECAEFEFSQDTATRYIEVAKRIRLEQQLSGKAQKRLAALSCEPDIDDESRAWLAKITEGRNLRQLYLDLDIITKPDAEPKAAKDAGPVLPPKSQAQAKLEAARESWFTWREQGEKLIRIGALDHLDKKGLEEMKEYQAWLRDRINTRLQTL